VLRISEVFQPAGVVVRVRQRAVAWIGFLSRGDELDFLGSKIVPFGARRSLAAQ
jgi:hypothetical protein